MISEMSKWRSFVLESGVADDVVHKCNFLKCTRAQSNDLSIPNMEINIGFLYRILYVVYTIEHL